MGDRRAEGVTLGYLGELLLSESDIEGGRAAFRAGEQLLRAIGDPLQLAMQLCGRGGRLSKQATCSLLRRLYC